MRRLMTLILVLIILICWWQVFAVRAGLTIREITRDGVPLTVMVRPAVPSAPGVIIGHGFAGSRQLMYGYGYGLAQAGYAVILLDFDGHAANAQPLNRDGLQANLATAYAVLLEQPEVDRQRVALLGHSMGSGAVLTAAVNQPDRYSATVAISPTSAPVSPTAPRNLLLQAGAWEPAFVANAQRLLAQAGGEQRDVAQGRGRRFIEIPWAEHITILFRAESHQAALAWFNQVFGLAGATTYPDYRIAWYLLHLVAWLALGKLGAHWLGLTGQSADADAGVKWRDRVQPLTTRRRAIRKTPSLDQTAMVEGQRAPVRQPRPMWLGLILAPLMASLALGVLSLGVDLSRLGGLQVGGAVGLWFALAGAVWLTWQWERVARLPDRAGRPTRRDMLLGLGLFALLWVAFGALAHWVWLPWLLIPTRLFLWPWLALACLPWFVAMGLALVNATTPGKLGQWAGQSVMLVLGWLVALWLVPSLGFIVLLLPLLPILTGLVMLGGARLNRPWAFGLGSALFLGWVIAATFPFSGN